MRANVEVDEIEIVNGPGSTRMFHVAVVMLDQSRNLMSLVTSDPSNRRINFRCKTKASEKVFPCAVVLDHMSLAMSGDPDSFYFMGTYGDTTVAGRYSVLSKTGCFFEVEA